MATFGDHWKGRAGGKAQSRWGSEQQPTPPPDEPTGGDQPPQDGPTKDPNALKGAPFV